jgi:predicted amidohydrolase YtcJ
MSAADLVLTGATLFGADHHPRGVPGTVAVRGGRIVAVGGPEVAELAGPRTETLDLTGRLLLPGFVDAHLHPLGGGLELAGCDLSGAITLDAYRAAVARYAAAHPDREWITGGGWSMEAFPGGLPHREQLDDLLGDRPAFLPNRDHHGAWVNAAALRRAGIDRDTPDPADGRIERDPDGTPTGVLQEGAMELVAALVPATTPDEELAALLAAQRKMHAFGITGWQDALVGANGPAPDPTRAYLAAIGAGLLTARVGAALWWDRGRGAEQVEELVARRAELAEAGLACPSVKMMLDGVAENHTAAMLSPYVDPCGHAHLGTGLHFLDPEELPKWVTALDAQGFGVHFHALGDRAVRDALDAVQAARETNGARGINGAGTRPHLAHLQVVHPHDVPRFAALRATANIQPLWAAHEPQMDELTLPFLTPERAGWQYPFGDLWRSGAHLACGSDWPVSTADPLAGLQVAVTRRVPGADPDVPPFLPGQRLDLATALTGYTAGSSFVNRRDDTGRLAPGYHADMAVLDRDILAGPPDEIAEARVLHTFVGGRLVHSTVG